VDHTVQQLTELMAPDNRIIDGGNSYCQDNLDHRSLDKAVSISVLSPALYSRFSSCGEAEFADTLLSAMRFE
jgi:6-phosphogluconate dehydrogenase (decarboxylating)